MCGITGFAGIKTDPMVIASMIGSIKHRGPDDDGYALHEDIGIGMTRLSIVDIGGGHQPIHSADGALSIVFNGEIYNYQALREEYLSQGGVLRTRSDTEVILALYERFREGCLEKLQGMFAFAILDRREKSLFIARDRVGIKPLYFWQANSTLVFGSEIKSLLASGQFAAEANPAAVARYLSVRYVPSPVSLFKGVQRLAPGHWMKWQNGALQTYCYWRPSIREKLRVSDAEVQERFDALFEHCVDSHRMGDVPHGAYLSGGLDSASIVSALSRQDARVKTFTIGFGWEKDELDAARDTARQLGTEHHEIICKPADFEHLPSIIWHSDEPLGDPIVLPTYMLAREASSQVKIVLTGEGADEILGGYLFHKAVMLADYYRRFVPNAAHAALIKPLIQMMPVKLLNAGFNYPGYLGDSGKKRLLSFLDLSRSADVAGLLSFFTSLFDVDEQNSVLTPEYRAEARVAQGISGGSMLDELLQLQYAHWLPDNILMRQDKMSMAHGLEVRVPFLDHTLVEFMETVPDHLKLNLRQNKVLLRNYAAKQGLRKVARGKKSAFYFPMEQCFESKVFQDMLEQTLGERQVKARGMFNHTAVQTLIGKMKQRDFLAAKQVFALVSLELWFQVFIDKKALGMSRAA